MAQWQRLRGWSSKQLFASTFRLRCRCPVHSFSSQPAKSGRKQRTKNKQFEKGKRQYSRRQNVIQYASYGLLMSITATTIYFTYRFQTEYVNPRKELIKDREYALDAKTRDRMMRDMANKFQQSMRFKTHQNEVISGIDILASRRFFILYFGATNCKQQCNRILQTIESSLNSRKLKKWQNVLSILFIDLNIFDSVDTLNDYFVNTLEMEPDSKANIMGLIPQNRETLRELMDTFSVYVSKLDGDGENMQLNHSNMVYLVDCDGLLYDVLGGEDEVTEENIIEKTINLLYHSESTFMGKMRNILSLTFQTGSLRQMPDRHVKHNPVPQPE